MQWNITDDHSDGQDDVRRPQGPGTNGNRSGDTEFNCSLVSVASHDLTPL